MFKNKLALSAFLIGLLLIFGTAETGAQDFGFGSTDASSSVPDVKVSGSLAFSVLAFPYELDSGDFADSAALPEARLNFEARVASAEGKLGFRVDRNLLANNPAALLDEAWLRIYAGKAIIQAGLQRLTWGRADSLSVLDIVNPRDLSNLTLRDENERKIAMPMVKLSGSLGERTTVDAVYLPWFEGDRIAVSGPWVPAALATGKASLEAAMADELYDAYAASTWAAVYAQAYSQTLTASGLAAFSNTTAIAAANAQVAAAAPALTARANAEAAAALADPFASPNTRGLDYGQAGARLSAGLGAVDLGLQYFYGYLTTPAYDMNPASIAAAGGKIPVSWNRYHQIGADMAFVLAGFNLRLEAGANLTEDSTGADPLIYNSAIVWAAGFDRSLFAGIDINLQAMGKLRLNHDAIVSPLDVEYGSKLTSTRVAALLSRSFARDRIKLELLGLYEIEKMDYMVEPGLVFAFGDAEIALRGRYFGGDSSGDLGQFNDKSYVSVSAKYKF
jgi:hypothetical protein